MPLQNFTTSQPYGGIKKQIVGNGKGLHITNIGFKKFSISDIKMVMYNILHVLHVTRIILSVLWFIQDNQLHLELYP